MSAAIVDTSIIIHLFRKNKAAHAWFAGLNDLHKVTSITWLEVIYGAPGKLGQKDSKAILDKFDLIRLNDADQDWAMEQMMLHRCDCANSC
jgi:predicted nucleic acid-binding protein